MLSQGNDDSVSQNSFCFCLAVYFKQNFLNKRATADPPTDTLIRLAELVLNKNTFSFRDEVFSQMSGVAMGTKMGPSYACLFMGHLEHTLLFRLHSPPPCVCVCVYVVFPPLSSHPL